MAHIFEVDKILRRVPYLFERQYRDHQVNIFFYHPNAIASPSPELGRDVIDNFYSAFFEPFDKLQIEIGKIHEDRGVWFHFADAPLKSDKCLEELRQRHSDLRQADDREVIGPNDRLDTGFPHSRARGTEKLDLTIRIFFAESLHEVCGVQVSGRLARDDK